MIAEESPAGVPHHCADMNGALKSGLCCADSHAGCSNSAGGLNYLLRTGDGSEMCRVACSKCFISRGGLRSKESHMAQRLNSCLWRRSNRELPPSGQITRLAVFPCVCCGNLAGSRREVSMMERDGIPCMLLPGQLHSTLDTLGYLLGLSELISEVTSSKCPSSFSPQPLLSGGSLPLPLENINVIPLAQPPLASLAGFGVYLKSA